MENIILSQRDPRWARVKLGFSNTTIGSHGCTITALTMMINRQFKTSFTPAEVNQALKEVKAFSNGATIGKGNLIVWSRVPLAFTKLKYVTRGYNYNNLVVSFWVNLRRIPQLVEVNASKIGATKHWVLFIGNRQMVDPWDGKVKSTNVYPLIGYAIYENKA